MQMANHKKWSIGPFEVAKSVGKNSGQKFKVYIGKVMPLISFGKPKKKIVQIKKSCFVNATKCKPSIASKVTIANYMTVPVANTSTMRKSVKHGTKLTVTVANGSVNQLSVTGKA